MKVVADLEAQLKESESRLEEREANKELEEELLVYKKESVEQHEKGFNKAIKQVGFFTKDLDLGLFDPFKDVKDGVLLDKEDFVAEEKIVNEEQGVAKQGNDAHV